MVRKRGVARKSSSHRRVRRVKKYDHHVIPRRFKIQLPSFADRLEPPLEVHVECEEPTMELLDSLGVPSDEQQYYLGFMKRMIELYLKFTAQTLQLEKDSLIAEYVLRGKDKDVLEAVQEQAAECAGVIVEMDLWTRDFYKLIQFQSLDGFLIDEVDTGSVSLLEGDITLSTGANINSEADLIDEITHPLVDLGTFLTWDKERRLRVGILFNNNTNQEIYILQGTWGLSLPDPSQKGFGFKIVNNEIFGYVVDGTTETLTGVLRTFNAGDEFILEARLTPTQKCVFYIDGVEVGSITTNLPSGLQSSNWIAHAHITNTAAADKSIQFDWWEFYQKR